MKTTRDGWRPLQRDELRDELVHDSYKSKKKLPEPTRCTDCSAVYERGRWRWGTAAAGAHETLCPACHRVRDRFPAGYVTLDGGFFSAHRDEILQRARHCAEREKQEHALERIMQIDERADGAVITTTDTHLARDIGEAIHAAYKGALEYHYNKQENLLRVHWRR